MQDAQSIATEQQAQDEHQQALQLAMLLSKGAHGHSLSVTMQACGMLLQFIAGSGPTSARPHLTGYMRALAELIDADTAQQTGLKH